MFCKSGILVFISAENNYSIYAHTMLIKTPLLHQSFGLHVLLSFFLFLSLSLSGYFFGMQRPSGFTFLPGLLRPSGEGTPSPSKEGAWGLCEQSKPHVRDFTGFLRKPRNISLVLSPLLSYRGLRTTRFWSIKGPQHVVTEEFTQTKQQLGPSHHYPFARLFQLAPTLVSFHLFWL